MTQSELQALIEQCGVWHGLGPEGQGYKMEQHPVELAQFLFAMQELSVTSMLEIGTGPYAGVARFVTEKLGWKVNSIDVNVPYYRHDAIAFHQVERGKRIAFDTPFDLVFIDADHSYEAVKADHEWYSVYALKVVAFHDICGLRGCEGTEQYWKEISPNDYQKVGGAKTILKRGYYTAVADGDLRVGFGWYVLSEVAKPTPTIEVKSEMGDVITFQDDALLESPKKRGRPKKARTA